MLSHISGLLDTHAHWLAVAAHRTCFKCEKLMKDGCLISLLQLQSNPGRSLYLLFEQRSAAVKVETENERERMPTPAFHVVVV